MRVADVYISWCNRDGGRAGRVRAGPGRPRAPHAARRSGSRLPLGGARGRPRRRRVALGPGLRRRGRLAEGLLARRSRQRRCTANRCATPERPLRQRRRSTRGAKHPATRIAVRYGQARPDGPRRQPREATRPGLPVERDLRRLPLHLGLRAPRRAPQAQRQGRLVAVDGAAPRRHRRPRRRHPHGAEGVGGERPRRDVHRPAGRLPQLQGALPRRPAARLRRLPELRHEGLLHRGPASST